MVQSLGLHTSTAMGQSLVKDPASHVARPKTNKQTNKTAFRVHLALTAHDNNVKYWYLCLHLSLVQLNRNLYRYTSAFIFNSPGYSDEYFVPVLAQRQKYRSMEQNRRPRDKSTHIWTPYLWQRRQEYTLKNKVSSTNSSGKIGQLNVKEWNQNIL